MTIEGMELAAPAVDVSKHVEAAKSLPKPRLIIGGTDIFEGSGGVFEHVNPATGLKQGDIPLGGAQEIDQAVVAATKAFRETWGPMRPRDRGRILRRFSEMLYDRRDDFAVVGTLEMGVASGQSGAVDAGLDLTAYYAGWADKIEGLVAEAYSPGEEFAYTIPEPYGVIGHIITWNAPFLSLGMKVSPSLAAGNCVVVKPAEFTPFTALLYAEIAREAGVPDGVINIAQGTGPAGEALVRHPGVSKISFTGGPATARRIMTTAAEGLKPVLFELGGKSANLLFPDADLDAAIPYSVGFGMSQTGQGCAIPTRLLVHDSIYDQVVERAVAVTEALKVGDPLDGTTAQGPVVNAAARDRIMGMINRAREQNAGTLLTGGSALPGDGQFIQPTVFADVDIDSELAQTEVFGPVLALSRFRDEDEAVRIANATEYGLSAYLQTRDIDRIKRLVPKLNAGTVFVNRGPTPVSVPGRPFGGVGISGFGKEGGKAGLDEFLMVKGVGIGSL